MEQKLNKFLLTLVLIGVIVMLVEIIYWFPSVADSTKRLNTAQCLESYNKQDQPPLGACGFRF